MLVADREDLRALSGSPWSRGRRRLVPGRGRSLDGGKAEKHLVLVGLSVGQKSWSVICRLRCRGGEPGSEVGGGSEAGWSGRGQGPPYWGVWGGEEEPRRRGSSTGLLMDPVHPEGEEERSGTGRGRRVA